jgi:transposase
MMLEAENLLDGDKKVDHPPNGSKDTTDACLSKSTKVMCLNGQTLALGSLAAGDRCWVYSIVDGQIRAGLATALGTTRRTATMLRVTLDNGESITATPDHLFMLRNGGYARADSLKTGQSLMPFYFKRTKKGYGTVFNPATCRHEKVYNLVDAQFRGVRPKGFTVHHDDLDKHNDQPDNLKRMTNAEHWALHRKIDGPIKFETEKNRQRELAEYNGRPATKLAAAERISYARQFSKDRTAQARSALPRLLSFEYRKQHGEFMHQRMSDPAVTTRQTQAIRQIAQAKWDSVPLDEIVRLRNDGATNRDIAAQFQISVSAVERRAKKARENGQVVEVNYRRDRSQDLLKSRRIKLAKLRNLLEEGWTVDAACSEIGTTPGTYYRWIRWLNHKVVTVEEAPAEDTTCLRVPGFENFAVAAGVFVHNCAGAYNNAINSEEKVMLMTPNNPRLHMTRDLEGLAAEKPPIEINLPPGYTRVKTFTA